MRIKAFWKHFIFSYYSFFFFLFILVMCTLYRTLKFLLSRCTIAHSVARDRDSTGEILNKKFFLSQSCRFQSNIFSLVYYNWTESILNLMKWDPYTTSDFDDYITLCIHLQTQNNNAIFNKKKKKLVLYIFK